MLLIISQMSQNIRMISLHTGGQVAVAVVVVLVLRIEGGDGGWLWCGV